MIENTSPSASKPSKFYLEHKDAMLGASVNPFDPIESGLASAKRAKP